MSSRPSNKHESCKLAHAPLILDCDLQRRRTIGAFQYFAITSTDQEVVQEIKKVKEQQPDKVQAVIDYFETNTEVQISAKDLEMVAAQSGFAKLM